MGPSKAEWPSVGCEAGLGGHYFIFTLKNYFKISLSGKNSNTQSKKNSKMNPHVTLAPFNDE